MHPYPSGSHTDSLAWHTFPRIFRVGETPVPSHGRPASQAFKIKVWMTNTSTSVRAWTELREGAGIQLETENAEGLAEGAACTASLDALAR